LHTTRELASLLWKQHQERIRFQSIADLLPGQRVSDAYAVQDELVHLMIPSAGPPRGYKIGLTSLRMQQMCGLNEPVAGRVLERRIHRGAARVALDGFARLGVESELCLLLKDDLPLRDAPFTVHEAAGAIGGAAAGFELIDDREADYARLDACSLIADNSWNAGVVLGASSSLGDTRASSDVGALAGVLYVDGQPVDSGKSSDALSHPFEVVRWLANHLRAFGSYLRAGDLVMTGSIVPTRFAKAGEHYRFELGGLPAAELWVV
jgi:2-keto-4-pentenoate hydratase